MRIHIYNPEHDYALASGSHYYTPPAEVVALRDRNALLPLKWADAGDAILIPDTVTKETLPDTPGVTVLHRAELSDFITEYPDAELAPWGWDPAIQFELLRHGIPEEKLPSEKWLDALREISHRRTTIKFNCLLNAELAANGHSRHISPLPIEFTTVEEALNWYDVQEEVFFKAPWSSSGRGILCTLELEREKHIEPWLRGMIRRQGSVMGEEMFAKHIDFATEWFISTDKEGYTKVDFLGFSSFSASGRGKYRFQVVGAKGLENLWIKANAPDMDQTFIDCQKRVILEIIDSMREDERYTGYLGIDMMADQNGQIRGCVELNFRRTMGIPALDVLVIGTGNVGTHLYKAFKEAGLRAGIVSGHAEIIPPADIYIISVKDDAVEETARRLDGSFIPGSLVAHTSGSVSYEKLSASFRDKSTPCGVFYPLQTFSKDVEMKYDEIPFLIEGSGPAATEELTTLAKRISRNVRTADSEERASYHVAAVIACNFSNHLCALADEYLAAEGLDFKILLPLLEQTIRKLHFASPRQAQTGPAIRGDRNVIEAHRNRLKGYPHITGIYDLLTESINITSNKGVNQ